MIKKEIHSKIYSFLIPLAGFFLPFMKLVPVIFTLLFLNWMTEGNFRNKFLRFKKNNIALLFSGFYLLLIAGMAWTQNIEAGMFDLQVKLSFLIMPLIFSTDAISENSKSRAMLLFVISCIIAGIIMVARAVEMYYSKGINHFYYSEFAMFQHPAYMSMYLNIGIAWLIVKLDDRKESRQLLFQMCLFFAVVFLSLVVFLLSSRAGLIGMLLVNLLLFIWLLYRRKKWTAILVPVFFSVLVFYFSNSETIAVDRLKTMINELCQNNPDYKSTESTFARMAIINASSHVISQNLIFGVGTGDVKNALMNEYQKSGMTGAYEKKFNAHNQFLQTMIALGIPGIIFLVLIFISTINFSWQNGNIFYMAFIMLAFFNFLFDF